MAAVTGQNKIGNPIIYTDNKNEVWEYLEYNGKPHYFKVVNGNRTNVAFAVPTGENAGSFYSGGDSGMLKFITDYAEKKDEITDEALAKLQHVGFNREQAANAPTKAAIEEKNERDINKGENTLKYESTESNILTSISDGIKNIYGNSLFCLSTVHDGVIDKNKKLKHIMLYGVMREMPEIGFKSTWEDGPGSTAKKWVKDFIKSDELESIQFFGGNGVNHIVFSDGWTAKVYDNSEVNSVTLKFRVYGNQDIGPVKMTSYEDWVYALSTFTPVASDANLTSLTEIGNQVTKTLDAAANIVTSAKDVLGKLINSTTDNVNTVLNSFENNANEYLQKYNVKRVYDEYNAKNNFGAKLFYLHIYPFIFKKTIPVFVSSWNFTPSKEVYAITVYEEAKDDKKIEKTIYKSLYYDFNITLETDQIPSQRTFNDIMT